VLQGLAELLEGRIELRLVPGGQAAEALGPDVALLLLSQVHYKTGRIHDMETLTAQAHAGGALTLWDLSHSAGVLDLRLNQDHADFAVGCGYKYLNGGPGAPAFLFAARRHHAAMRLPLTGWMGHAAPFAFEDGYRAGIGVRQGLCGTPPVLSMSALDAALDAFDDVFMAEVRAKSMALTDLFLKLVEQPSCAP
jgi:kynureninase